MPEAESKDGTTSGAQPAQSNPYGQEKAHADYPGTVAEPAQLQLRTRAGSVDAAHGVSQASGAEAPPSPAQTALCHQDMAQQNTPVYVSVIAGQVPGPGSAAVESAKEGDGENPSSSFLYLVENGLPRCLDHWKGLDLFNVEHAVYLKLQAEHCSAARSINSESDQKLVRLSTLGMHKMSMVCCVLQSYALSNKTINSWNCLC